MKVVISALLLATLALTPCTSFGDYEQAVEAYKAGDYETAVKLLRPLAEQGDTDAQFNLGVMYYSGQGVLEDSIQAYAWFNIASANVVKKGNKNNAKLKLTQASIEKAQALSRKMVEENPRLLGD